MDRIKSAEIFVRVVELSSFTAASRDMNIPKSTVSAAIRQIETGLGTTLLQRTTRRMHITHEGQLVYEHCKGLLASVEEIHGLFSKNRGELTGSVRVDMAQALARNIVLPRLAEFLDEHPKLKVELSGTDSRVDMIQDGFDCVLRMGQLRNSNLFARRLGHFRQLNCASPGYLSRHGTPQNLADLAQHRMLRYSPGFKRQDEPRTSPDSAQREPLSYPSGFGGPATEFKYPQGNGYATLPMDGNLTVSNTEIYEGACVAGLGIIQAPQPCVQHYLDSGQLVSIMPELLAEPMPVSLLYADRRHLTRRTRALMDWLENLLQPYLIKTSPPTAPAPHTVATPAANEAANGGVQ